MSCTGYTPLTKTVLQHAIGDVPPENGVVKIHIKQMLTDGTVLSDSIKNHPLGHIIDLTNTHVLSSLIDELMVMVPGEISQFLCKRGEMNSGLFSVDLPPEQDLILEVEMLDWFGQDISPNQDKSLMKIIVEEGTSKGHPCWTGKCTLALSSKENPEQEILFRLGDGASYNIPNSVELCALTMRRSEICRLDTPHITYTVRLISFEKERPLYKLDIPEVVKLAEELKTRGNSAYKVNKLSLARLYYDRCITYVDGIVKSEQTEVTAELLRDCNLNLAQVYLKQSNYSAAVSHATTVLWTYPCSVKALYRRALAYEKQCFYEEAVDDLTAVLGIDSDNAAARALLTKVRCSKENAAEKDKLRLRSVFKKIDAENASSSLNAEPVKSVWEEAEESCPAELATEEAYKVYADQLAEEDRIRKAEAAAKQAEYLAANPPKKKKKKKKKKKPATNEVTIAETEEVKVDEKPAPEVQPEPDADMKYEVTAEKTFISKSETVDFVTGHSVTGHSDTQLDNGLKRAHNAVNKADNNVTVKPATVVESATDSIKPDTVVESATDSIKPVIVMESATDSIKPDTVVESATDSIKPDTVVESATDSIKPATVVESATDSIKPATVVESATDSIKPDTVVESATDSIKELVIVNGTVNGTESNAVGACDNK